MFEGRVLHLSAIMEIALPDDRFIRLCDGGFLNWGDRHFASIDPDFGTIEGAEAIEEKTGDEAPGGKITFLPATAAAAATLSHPSYQGARMRWWMARVDPETGLLIGDPELSADLAIDTTSLRLARGSRKLDIEFESAAKRLFMVMRGNALNDRFHQVCYPGELGMANATGMPRSSAWGVSS